MMKMGEPGTSVCTCAPNNSNKIKQVTLQNFGILEQFGLSTRLSCDTDLSKETWKVFGAFDFTDSLPTSSLRGLDNDWIANFLSPLQGKTTLTTQGLTMEPNISFFFLICLLPARRLHPARSPGCRSLREH